jgi:GTPase
VEPLPMDQTDPLLNYRTIREELKLYDATLLERPEIVVVSKSELPESEELAAQLQNELQRPVLRISAVTGRGLPELIAAISRELAALNEPVV